MVIQFKNNNAIREVQYKSGTNLVASGKAVELSEEETTKFFVAKKKAKAEKRTHYNKKHTKGAKTNAYNKLVAYVLNKDNKLTVDQIIFRQNYLEKQEQKKQEVSIIKDTINADAKDTRSLKEIVLDFYTVNGIFTIPDWAKEIAHSFKLKNPEILILLNLNRLQSFTGNLAETVNTLAMNVVLHEMTLEERKAYKAGDQTLFQKNTITLINKWADTKKDSDSRRGKKVAIITKEKQIPVFSYGTINEEDIDHKVHFSKKDGLYIINLRQGYVEILKSDVENPTTYAKVSKTSFRIILGNVDISNLEWTDYTAVLIKEDKKQVQILKKDDTIIGVRLVKIK